LNRTVLIQHLASDMRTPNTKHPTPGALRLSKPEWSIIAGVIVIVVSIVLPLVYAVHSYGLAKEAWLGIHALVDAGNRYAAEYGTWPTDRSIGVVDVRFGRGGVPNREIVTALRGLDGIGNREHALNPRRIVFLEFGDFEQGRSGIDDHGDFLDPWGTPYQVVMDTDLNGVCDVENSIYGSGIPASMIVWSCGPDRRSDTGDDILSWRR